MCPATSSVRACGSSSSSAAQARAWSGGPSATRAAATSSARTTAVSGSSVPGRRRAWSRRRSDRSTRRSRSSLSGTPSAGPPAAGRKRTPMMIVPAGISVGLGPVSGPATYAPRPGSQIRSVHASGSTRPRRVLPSGVTCAHRHAMACRNPAGAGHSVYPGSKSRTAGPAAMSARDPTLPACHADGRFVQYGRARPWWEGPMNAPDFDAAATFIAVHARVVDRRRFGRLFGGGPAGPVRDAVAAYRNDDGGFGHGLEPDCRAPGSQPPAVEMAFRIMDEADAWDDALVRGACDWLAAVAPAEGGAAFVEAGPQALDGWPHAPWWVPEADHPASLTPTGLISGTLHARGVGHPWLDRATEV